MLNILDWQNFITANYGTATASCKRVQLSYSTEKELVIQSTAMKKIKSKYGDLTLHDKDNILIARWHMIRFCISEHNCLSELQRKGIFTDLVSTSHTKVTKGLNISLSKSQASGSQNKDVYFSDYWFLVPVGVLIIMVHHDVTKAACVLNQTSPRKYRFLLPTKMSSQQHKLPREFKQNSDCTILLSSYNSHYKLDSNPFETAKHGKVSAMTFFRF